MSLKNLVLNLAFVAATSLVAVVLAGYLCSASMARVAHGSHVGKTLAGHGVMPASRIPHAGPRRVGTYTALTLPQSATDTLTR
jgi:hypothetical protein